MTTYDRRDTIAERIRRRWTIANLAERTAIDINYLTEFEQGMRWLPPNYAARLETALRSHSTAERELLPV